MPGLNRMVLDAIHPDRVLDRIRTDVGTDFILAPHYNAIFVNAGEDIWAETRRLLEAGKYQPELPHTISVLKERGFTRPGSILSPIDRFVYQALVDLISPTLESNIDRSRAFSHTLDEENGGMFRPAHDSWMRLQDKITELCAMGGFVVKADIANYFERIPQHHLVGLIKMAGCTPEVVNLLEELLFAFQERDSFGIIQGVFPSDVLGNFYLTEFDSFCELNEIPSARYVDDLYLHFPTLVAARRGLIELIRRLRQNGLHLNEYKSGIRTAKEVIREETEIDVLFGEAREEVEAELAAADTTTYGFMADWELNETEEPKEGEVELAAVKRLYDAIRENPGQSDKIERFCLPILRVIGSDYVVNSVVEGLASRPHLAQLHHAYLSRFVRDDAGLVHKLEALVQSSELVTDYDDVHTRIVV